MATLVFTAIGTALGGPLGGAIGGLIGRQVDASLFGPSGRSGPRLSDLKATTSSYGSAIPQHHGTIRAAGTIIWSTDLVEHSQKEGGGKSASSATVYTYSASFAVALSSRPIRDVGRIWADGNLLRGAAGDLKTGGTMRIYTGHGDHDPDPLIASAEGALSPAFRGTAYIVFEDLDLSTFGNRIPALTFEVIADEGDVTLAQVLEGLDTKVETSLPLNKLAGFTYEGGALVSTLSTIDSVYPLALDAGGDALTIVAADTVPAEPPVLAQSARTKSDGGFGPDNGLQKKRQASDSDVPSALRYYDIARDYLTGLQRADGRAKPGRDRTIDFPGALAAVDARSLANAAAERAGWARETMAWRVAELDPALAPGTIVRAPGVAGAWRITSWEWREDGVELELLRLPKMPGRQPVADPGDARLPPDLLAGPTGLEAFELPWDGTGSSDQRRVYAAPSSAGAGWSGATLYVDQGGTLITLGSSKRRAVIGESTSVLGSSPSLLLERDATVSIALAAEDFALTSATPEALAGGANRALLDGELFQFAEALPLGPGAWQLRGLLRGRGGTEAAAKAGHGSGSRFALLDDALQSLDPVSVGEGAVQILTAGLGDATPVAATIANPGLTLRPLVPVHPKARTHAGAEIELGWTRRARGGWAWRDEVDVPLAEQQEAYRVGLGPVASPFLSWDVTAPALTIAATTAAEIAVDHPGQPLWVRQIGSHALSDPLLLMTLP